METVAINMRVDVKIHKEFKAACVVRDVTMTEVMAQLMSCWTENPDLLRSAAVAAAASALGVSSEQLVPREVASVAELRDLAENPHLNLEELRVLDKDAASDRLLAIDVAEMDSVFGVAPKEGPFVALGAKIVKRQVTEPVPMSAEHESELLPDASPPQTFEEF